MSIILNNLTYISSMNTKWNKTGNLCDFENYHIEIFNEFKNGRWIVIMLSNITW